MVSTGMTGSTSTSGVTRHSTKPATRSCEAHQNLAANDPSIPGRLIAQCTLGTWVGLLDQGGWTGDGSTRRQVDYEELWRDTLHKAFPGGRTVARLRGERFTRSYTHRIAKNVHTLRNRIAHHEPLINGVPLNGQAERLSLQEAVTDYVDQTSMIDKNLSQWLLKEFSHTASLLSSYPFFDINSPVC